MKNNINIIHTGRLKVKKYFSAFALALSLSAFAQTMTENYVYSKVSLSEDGSKKSETIQYFDGLGRPKQTIQVKSTPLGQDIVMPVTYDQLGRQTRSILPVPMATSNLGIQNVSEATANTYYGVPNAYSEQKLEASPLARVLETASPGSEWAMNSGHTRKATYEVNKTPDKVKKFSFTNSWVNATTISSVPTVSLYNEKVLVKTSATDEDGNKSIEFTNGLGQTVLVRKVITATENVDTYYLYNDYGQLVYVISPKAEAPITSNNNIITQQILDDLCYQYKYDNKGRLVEKKVPGKGWEYMIYDRQNRLVGSQDAELKKKGQWLYTKYDQFGRVAFTGISAGGSRISEQDLANNFVYNNVKRTNFPFFNREGMDVFYDPDQTYPNVVWVKLLSVNYYDTYPGYSFNPPFPSAIFGKPVLKDDLSGNVSTRTLPVMSLVKNIEDDNWTKNYNYYDTKGRSVGGYSINHLGGSTRTESELDFAGVPLQTKAYHKRLNTDTERVITQTFTYDNQNRLLTHTHQVDSNTPEILTQNKYNELSQLQSKKVGGTSAASPLQTVDYTYNIRGWITKINDPANLNGKLFGYEIKYQNSTNPYYARFSGNISEIDWKTSVDDLLKRYIYAYDPLNRLTAGYYQEPTTSVPINHFYNEEIAYDLNGNITRLQRNMKGSNNSSEYIDNIFYTYSGNRLISASDAAQNYNGYPAGGKLIDYDDNGNMINQKDKNISAIQYNYLNLPYSIKISEGKQGIITKDIQYTYRADGVKVAKKYTPFLGNIETNYLDGFQYDNKETGETSQPLPPSLKFVSTSEGYYNFENNKYIYNYTDHLGNVRVSYFKNGSGLEVLEESNYYPFGLKHGISNPSVGNPSYNYKYNGKELQETGMYDYGARMYMPDLGRWGVIDPLAEASRRFTPYHYGNNNPIRFTDPDGRLTVDNLQGGYTPGSAVMDFFNRNGLTDERNMPLFYRNEGGAMIRTEALGKDGEGGGGGSFTFTGKDAVSVFNYFNNGGSMSGLSFGDNDVTWWTGTPSLTAYSGADIHGEIDLGIGYSAKFKELPLDAYKNWADWGASTAGGGFKYLADRRTSLYNSGYWIDNLGQMRNTAYAGRARGSLIGLRSDYLRNTAMLGKYAKRAGYVGYGISAAQIGYGMYKDGGKFGIKAQIATANVAGGMAGAAVGAWLGVKVLTPIGGAIGAAFAGVGAAPGAAIGGAIGGIVGGIVGGVYGGDYAEQWASDILNKPSY
ncbi:sugar-binding protein [Chryseobacterium sp. KBW03]|uniref:DUF6443 domain-containing protein n=1 Tax=Chryseobacterium sp. KBW03 TaxID=2153362 RepID=UPI000F597162|nr:DUF6443 domain-containing protein [Chryseobacterium sp. KBW03]RQO41572.1 sugar-binding protein [Chryseobacterium sp. KBW03]